MKAVAPTATSPRPSTEELIWSTAFYNGILAILALIGLVWVLREWRVYGRWHTDRKGP